MGNCVCQPAKDHADFKEEDELDAQRANDHVQASETEEPTVLLSEDVVEFAALVAMTNCASNLPSA